ncbi:MAG TPA: LamG domain-containing protein, partial [Candidatus Sumerlaeota bacterium]|nr:LamG domain-containing protein [Candidatus Sumerlaeota bacterium]
DQIAQLAKRPPLPSPVAYYKLDETTGTIALDSSGNGFHGVLENGLDFTSGTVSGVYGNGLYFDGEEDRIEIPPLRLNSNRVTICGWIKRDGPQIEWAGLVFGRSGRDIALGLHLGPNNDLRYTWSRNHVATYSWNAGLVVPDNKWVFVALTLQPDKAMLHLIEDGVLRTSSQEFQNTPEPFEIPLNIGLDNYTDPRRFKGSMDDIRIYDRTLSPSDLEEIAGRRQRGLKLHLALDESSGRKAEDISGRGHESTLQGLLNFDRNSRSAVIGKGLVFDGVTSYISAPVSLNSDKATISAWIQRDGDQKPWTGIVLNRFQGYKNESAGGLHFGTHNELRYTWNLNSPGTWSWDSGLLVPDKQWVHVALVVEPSQARLYLTTRDGMTSATRNIGHERDMLHGETGIGFDAYSDWDRFFKGMIDDVLIYDKALSPAEIQQLASQWPTDIDPSAFISNPFQKRVAVEGWPYRQNLLENVRASDRNGYLVFAKLDGPDWLKVAETGEISGTPNASNLGVNQFTVSVRDSWGNRDQAVMQIPVVATGATFDVGSVTSPAWVEDYLTTSSQKAGASVVGGTLLPVVMESSTRFYVDNASKNTDGTPTGKSAGVLLEPGAPITLSLTATSPNGSVASIQPVLNWMPTDLAGKAVSDVLYIRVGDSLLLTANGTGSSLAIDSNGDSVFEYNGIPGDKFPYRYASVGKYNIVASIDGQQVGTLSVVVLGVDFGSSTYCEMNYRRLKGVTVQPAGQVSSICFSAADPDTLSVSMYDSQVTTPTLTLTPFTTGTLNLQARVGNSCGPIIVQNAMTAFTMRSSGVKATSVVETYPDGAVRIENTLKMDPLVRGLDVKIWIFVPKATFPDSTSVQWFSTDDFDASGLKKYWIVYLPGSVYGPCHVIHLFQDGVQIGS